MKQIETLIAELFVIFDDYFVKQIMLIERERCVMTKRIQDNRIIHRMIDNFILY